MARQAKPKPAAASTRPPSLERAVEPAEALSLTDSAAAQIAAKINSGEWLPGERLPSERALATELSVSRPALREAVRALQAAGLVRVKPKSGWYVTEHGTDAGAMSLVRWMQVQPVGEIVAVRRILEPESVRAIPAIRVASLVAECQGIIDAMSEAADEGRHEEAVRLHSQFHRALVQYSPSRLAFTLQVSMIEAAESAQREIFRTPRASRHSTSRHTHILDALIEGDIEEVAQRVAQHLEPAFTFPRDRGDID
jgi:GntR family transcriptional regulator, transcriptional repressor for pyruvate dehydrogenase complex